MSLTFEQVKSSFIIAGFQILGHWELMNQYWPSAYTEQIVKNPWFLVLTEFGLIRVGPRKRVIHIDWEATNLRAIITEDDTTKDESMVHAWSLVDMTRYLAALREKFVSESKGDDQLAEAYCLINKSGAVHSLSFDLIETEGMAKTLNQRMITLREVQPK